MKGKKIHFENLDGLRFLAFLSVFLFHSFYTDQVQIKNDQLFNWFYLLTRYGWLGVNFFFVLSGFLITYLILMEEEFVGSFNLKWFYTRRILRIWPLYYLIIGICFFVYPVTANIVLDKNIAVPDPLLFLVHLSNYNYIYYPSEIPTLNILWSISVEEQFYLLWPILLSFVKGKNRVLAFIIIIISSLTFTWLNRDDFHYYHHHLLTSMLDLTLGGFAAYLTINSKSFRSLIETQTRAFILIMYLLFALYFSGLIMRAFGNIELLTALIFIFIILEQNYSVNSFFKVSKIPFVSILGKYTYGLYCYHYLALLFAIQVSKKLNFNTSIVGVLVFENLLGLLISIGLAMLSYHVFEKPFLKLKDQVSYFTTVSDKN